MDLMDAQPEFTRSFWEYLDTLVSDARIAEIERVIGTAPVQPDRQLDGTLGRPPEVG